MQNCVTFFYIQLHAVREYMRRCSPTCPLTQATCMILLKVSSSKCTLFRTLHLNSHELIMSWRSVDHHIYSCHADYGYIQTHINFCPDSSGACSSGGLACTAYHYSSSYSDTGTGVNVQALALLAESGWSFFLVVKGGVKDQDVCSDCHHPVLQVGAVRPYRLLPGDAEPIMERPVLLGP